MHGLTSVLAADISTTEWAIAIGLFVLIMVGGGVMVMVIQRRMDPRKAAGGEESVAMTTEELARMLEAGTISESEYEVMRQIVIGKTMARTREAETRQDEQAQRPDDGPSANG
ncbi:MAG: hypothetical protein GVY16_11355 [Planctomycetes bacterium]|jgi:hypothetical protein|nr:hypothetical protein [Planctomycetota bacterium]